ncbi:MAG: phosphocarrier protein HPr [Spartobacteria bacterium AMD-G4]|jgi:phosphocarrier protein HPr|nr:MAG: phosphocarrier protein HPr [Spartobacteria bacterium AMD-G4]
MGILTKKKTPDDQQKIVCEVVIENRNGLHARPAAMFVKISSRYRSEVWVEKDGERVNGKSIMGLMMLAAGKGSKLSILADGVDAEKAVAEIKNLVETRFGED